MFVQHIIVIASLKPDGHMDTIMLHGMLFRGQPAPLLVEAPLRLAQARPVLGLVRPGACPVVWRDRPSGGLEGTRAATRPPRAG